MKRSIRTLTIPAVVVAVAAVGTTGAAVGRTPAPSATSATTAKVEVINTKLGKVLGDGSGRTLYLFGKDKGSKSSCSGMCAQAWPPLTTTGKPKAGSGISASKLGTTSRAGGVKQVTYNGHPLYGFIKDTGPRQTHGEGLTAFGGQWHVLTAAGNKK
jgi:predicted lipoprotein with Yx(FWY)xxD motif